MSCTGTGIRDLELETKPGVDGEVDSSQTRNCWGISHDGEYEQCRCETVHGCLVEKGRKTNRLLTPEVDEEEAAEGELYAGEVVVVDG